MYESDNGIKLYSDTSFMCLCGVAGCVCWDLAWEHSASSLLSCPPNLCLQQPYILPIFMQGKTGLTCWLKPLSKRWPTHHLCLSLIQFHIQNDKIIYLTLWANIGPTLTIWNWFRWAGLLPESQWLHGWFWREDWWFLCWMPWFGISFWAVSLPMQKIPADMEDPMFDSWVAD